jgi:hypothetical protein
MDHIEVYPVCIQVVNDLVTAGKTFTAYEAHKLVQQSTQDPTISYDSVTRPALHVLGIQAVNSGVYAMRLEDFGGRTPAWVYEPVGVTPARPTPLQPRMFNVDSTSLFSVGYDYSLGLLWVIFTSGRTYFYDDVDPETFVGLLYAESHGKYFNANIKDQHDYQEV